jgi:hypothetical protein
VSPANKHECVNLPDPCKATVAAAWRVLLACHTLQHAAGCTCQSLAARRCFKLFLYVSRFKKPHSCVPRAAHQIQITSCCNVLQVMVPRMSIAIRPHWRHPHRTASNGVLQVGQALQEGRPPAALGTPAERLLSRLCLYARLWPQSLHPPRTCVNLGSLQLSSKRYRERGFPCRSLELAEMPSATLCMQLALRWQ